MRQDKYFQCGKNVYAHKTLNKTYKCTIKSTIQELTEKELHTPNRLMQFQPELIEAHGYIAETHQVWTKDDYCLRVHRVISPNDRVSSNNDVLTDTDTSATDNNADDQSVPLNCNQDVRISCTGLKLPILLNHGLLSSSADFVLLGPRRALGYYIFLSYKFLLNLNCIFYFVFSFFFFFLFLITRW